MNDSKTKQFRVIGLLSPSRIVLDCGKNYDIARGMHFSVYSFGSEMKDVETGDVLERVFLPRGTGKVVVLQDKICTIESVQRKFTGVAIYSFGANQEIVPFLGPQVGDFADLIVES